MEEKNEHCGRTIQQTAKYQGVSLSTIKRAISHGLISVIYFGDRPIIPHAENERIAREGLPHIPPGYRRMTTGPVRGGRPPRKAKAKASARRCRGRLSISCNNCNGEFNADGKRNAKHHEPAHAAAWFTGPRYQQQRRCDARRARARGRAAGHRPCCWPRHQCPGGRDQERRHHRSLPAVGFDHMAALANVGRGNPAQQPPVRGFGGSGDDPERWRTAMVEAGVGIVTRGQYQFRHRHGGHHAHGHACLARQVGWRRSGDPDVGRDHATDPVRARRHANVVHRLDVHTRLSNLGSSNPRCSMVLYTREGRVKAGAMCCRAPVELAHGQVVQRRNQLDRGHVDALLRVTTVVNRH